MKIIKKAIGFTEEEKETLVSAGKILREALNTLNEDRTTNILDGDSLNLVSALSRITSEIDPEGELNREE